MFLLDCIRDSQRPRSKAFIYKCPEAFTVVTFRLEIIFRARRVTSSSPVAKCRFPTRNYPVPYPGTPRCAEASIFLCGSAQRPLGDSRFNGRAVPDTVVRRRTIPLHRTLLGPY